MEPTQPAAPAHETSPTALGLAVVERFYKNRLLTAGPRRAIGRLSISASSFGLLVGRSLSTRRALVAATGATTGQTSSLPVALPMPNYLAAWWSYARAATATPQEAVPEHLGALASVLPPRGLPKATTRGARSPMGIGTGPGGAAVRYVGAPVAVRREPEVSAVGQILTTREAQWTAPTRQAVPRPPTAAPSSARATRPEPGDVRQSVSPAPPVPTPTPVAAPPRRARAARSAPGATVQAASAAEPRDVAAPALELAALTPRSTSLRERAAAPRRATPPPPPARRPTRDRSPGATTREPLTSNRSARPVPRSDDTPHSPGSEIASGATLARAVRSRPGVEHAEEPTRRGPNGGVTPIARLAVFPTAMPGAVVAQRAAREQPVPILASTPLTTRAADLAPGELLPLGLLRARATTSAARTAVAAPASPSSAALAATRPSAATTAPTTGEPMARPTAVPPGTTRTVPVLVGDLPGALAAEPLDRSSAARRTVTAGADADAVLQRAVGRFTRAAREPALVRALLRPRAFTTALDRAPAPRPDQPTDERGRTRPSVFASLEPTASPPRATRTSPRATAALLRATPSLATSPDDARPPGRTGAPDRRGNASTVAVRELAAAIGLVRSLDRSGQLLRKQVAPPANTGASRPPVTTSTAAPASAQAPETSSAMHADPGSRDTSLRHAVAGFESARPTGTPVPGSLQPTARFLETLAMRRPDPTVALPRHLQPLAVAIAGPAPVRLRTGTSAAAALAAVNRKAATVDRVIHLASPPDRSPASTAIIAHELVHAVNPSTTPRFFEDPHSSPEEQLARRVGDLARSLASSEASPQTGRRRDLTWGTAGLQVSALQRVGREERAATATPRPPAPRPSAEPPTPLVSAARSAAAPGGTVPADLLQRFVNGPGRLPASPTPVQRWERTTPSSDSGSGTSRPGNHHRAVTPWERAAPGLDTGPTIRRLGSSRLGSHRQGVTPVDPNPALAESTGPKLPAETLDWIIEQIEQRIIDELERRGLRHNPGVF